LGHELILLKLSACSKLQRRW